MNCPVCNVPVKGKSGYCLTHWRTHGMPKRIGSDKSIRDKMSASMKRFYMENPERKSAQVRSLREIQKRPEVIAAKSAAAKERRIWEVGAAHLVGNTEARARAGRKVREKKLGWCPDYLRDTYRQLVRQKGYNAAEAREIIEIEHARTVQRMMRDAS